MDHGLSVGDLPALSDYPAVRTDRLLQCLAPCRSAACGMVGLRALPPRSASFLAGVAGRMALRLLALHADRHGRWRTSIVLANFFVPTLANQLGNLPAFGAITSRFRNALYESGGYLRLPLLAIVVLFARERWHDRTGRFMLLVFGCACILAMGPLL